MSFAAENAEVGWANWSEVLRLEISLGTRPRVIQLFGPTWTALSDRKGVKIFAAEIKIQALAGPTEEITLHQIYTQFRSCVCIIVSSTHSATTLAPVSNARLAKV